MDTVFILFLSSLFLFILCAIFGVPLLLCLRSEPLHMLERDAC